jgi:hypothetical protein
MTEVTFYLRNAQLDWYDFRKLRSVTQTIPVQLRVLIPTTKRTIGIVTYTDTLQRNSEEENPSCVSPVPFLRRIFNGGTYSQWL